MDIPLIVKRGNTVGDVCELIHRDFKNNFRYAMVWGKSAKFPGQTVGMDHKVQDEDVLCIIVKRRPPDPEAGPRFLICLPAPICI